MNSINSVTLTGRLTRDPELKKTPSDKSVCSFTIAVNDKFNKEQTHFINCVAWNQKADFIATYLPKGALIGVEGRLSQRTYEDKDGKRVYVTEVVADNVMGLESRAQREAQGATSPQGSIDEQSDLLPGAILPIDETDLPF